MSGVVETYAYDEGDKPVSITSGANVRVFRYGDRGRRETEYVNDVRTRTYAWTDDDRLTGVAYSNPSGTAFAGSYGPGGARVGKSDSGEARAFLRSGPGVTAPVLSDGAATYTPGVSAVRGGVSTFTTGGLKTQDAQWSSSGALTATRTYDAFGDLVGTTGTWQGPFGYAGGFGYQEDATGLKLLGHRYYDPSTGRFLTRDPIKDGRNWYAYCEGEPVSFVDPEGLRPTVTIHVTNVRKGHAWVEVDYADRRGRVVIEINMIGNVRIGDDTANPRHRPGASRTLPFDPRHFPHPGDIVRDLPDEYNLSTNNCVTVAILVWERLTGEDLLEGRDTPGRLERDIKRLNRRDLERG